mmetsp:Transcript_83674/g.213068  ORF Transcript_83674/g.213068 Transcript_83674/m.213068 type:complete len:208 (+) Transcript_83674:11-634(+)
MDGRAVFQHTHLPRCLCVLYGHLKVPALHSPTVQQEKHDETEWTSCCAKEGFHIVSCSAACRTCPPGRRLKRSRKRSTASVGAQGAAMASMCKAVRTWFTMASPLDSCSSRYSTASKSMTSLRSSSARSWCACVTSVFRSSRAPHSARSRAVRCASRRCAASPGAAEASWSEARSPASMAAKASAESRWRRPMSRGTSRPSVASQAI